MNMSHKGPRTPTLRRPGLIGLAVLCAWLACPWPAAAQHSQTEHRRPPDITQYLEQLDRPERDQ